ncbi:MAG: MgtC/SapB family protein, partial [Methyloceanibacter sp.]
MEQYDLTSDAIHFGVAALLGALVGIEREKHRRERRAKTEQSAGLRTFILLALFGACTAWLARAFDSYWIVVAGLLITGAFVVAGYVVTTRGQQQSLGLTTEIAAIVVFVLGAIVMLGGAEIAVALAVVTTAVLAYKNPMHGFVKQLGWDDVYSGLQLL